MERSSMSSHGRPDQPVRLTLCERRAGLGLVEVLVLLIVITILALVIIPRYVKWGGARPAPRRAVA